MKHLLLIFISILLLSSPLFGDNHKGKTLYRWNNFPPYKWMGHGDKDTHPKYLGQVQDGKPNGLGILISPNYSIVTKWKYVGGLKDGRLNGQGTLTYSDGMRYVGEFKDGKKHGQGSLIYSDGDVFDGEYKDNKLWNGTEYDKKGVIKYNYVNGKKIKQ